MVKSPNLGRRTGVQMTVGVLAMMLAGACSGQQADSVSSPEQRHSKSSPESKQEVERVWSRYWEMLGRHDVASLGDVLAENYRHHGPGGTTEGLENFKKGLLALWAGGPDATYVRDVAVVDGDKIAYYYRVNATHTGTLMGVPPTGKTVTSHGMAIYRVESGKIVEGWNIVDRLGLMQQIGAIPMPAPSR